jgi:ferredoxin--NADP+ reductase
MYKITHKQLLSDRAKKVDVRAERISHKWQPGQFVILMPTRYSQRIPMTTVDVDPQRGIISLIFEETNATTKALGDLKIGDTLFSLIGPLGSPVEQEKMGTVVCVSEEVGVATTAPICRALRKAENKIIGIAGFHLKKDQILETQMRMGCQKIRIVIEKAGATQKPGEFRKGNVVDALAEILEKEDVTRVYAHCSVRTLKDLCQLTAEAGVDTRVNITPSLTEDLSVFDTTCIPFNGKDFYVSYDGPFVDGHQVDYAALIRMINSRKEFFECQNKKSRLKSQINESGIFPRFFSGLVKEKP